MSIHDSNAEIELCDVPYVDDAVFCHAVVDATQIISDLKDTTAIVAEPFKSRGMCLTSNVTGPRRVLPSVLV